SRGPGEGLLCGHSGDPGGIGRLVLRGRDARNRPVESRARAPDAALQVLRLPHGVVASARASATRCPAHPAAASAAHRAGGSTYVRSVTLQRRTWREAVERRPVSQPFRTRGKGLGEPRSPSPVRVSPKRYFAAISPQET